MAFLELPDVKLWHTQEGDGPDIVWIPGGDNAAEDWGHQVRAFADDFRNTAFDPRGAGRTESRRSPPWSISDMADDCANLIRAVCSPPVTVIGLSMGSLVTLQVALDYPDLVRCAIAMGTEAKATGFARDWMIAEVEFRRGGGRLSPDFAVHHYGAFMYPSEVLGNDDLWYALRLFVARSYGEREGELLDAQWQACIDFDVTEQLPECEVPVHVIAFSQDMQAPPSLGQRVADLARDGHYHLLDGLGHLSLVGHRPEMVNTCIREILAGYEDDEP